MQDFEVSSRKGRRLLWLEERARGWKRTLWKMLWEIIKVKIVRALSNL